MPYRRSMMCPERIWMFLMTTVTKTIGNPKCQNNHGTVADLCGLPGSELPSDATSS